MDEERYLTLVKDLLECMNMPRPQGSYNYPVYPGMEEWASFKTVQEMVKACEIPTHILKRQTTQAVFQGIWEYPFFTQIAHRNSYYQRDFDFVYGNKNVYKEFITREDAGQCLYSRLLLVDPLHPASFYSQGLEFFMSQSIFLQQLSIEEKKEVIKISFKNDAIRYPAPQAEYYISRDITLLLIGRVLVNSNYKPFVDLIINDSQLKSFLEALELNGYFPDDYRRFFQVITSNGKAFINE